MPLLLEQKLHSSRLTNRVKATNILPVLILNPLKNPKKCISEKAILFVLSVPKVQILILMTSLY